MASTIRIPTEFTAVDRFSSVVRRMTAGVSNFSRSTQSAVMRVDSRINRMFGSLDRLSQLALGAGVAGMFTLAIQNNIAYNESLQSISAITGATGKDLANLEKQAFKTAKSQNMLGADVFKAYELIASAKPELLTNTKLLDEVANATSLLSKSAKMDMASSADSLTTSLNQFRLGGEKSLKVVDALSAGTVYGASSIKQTTDALTKFGTVAAATGTKVEESIALIQLASPFEKGAEAGTKLRNILSKMAGAKILPKDALKVLDKYGVNLDVVTNKSLPLAKRLAEMGKIGKDTTAVMQVFGLENQALAQAILQDVPAFDKMLKGVNEVGWAQKMASKNTNTFMAGIDAVKNAFFNATTATNSNNKSVQLIIDSMFFLSNNMETVIGAVGVLGMAFVTLKALVIGMRIATTAFSIAQGISAVVMGKSAMALRGNETAMKAYRVSAWLASAAQWALNTAMSMNPIGLVIIGVTALIALVAVMIAKWDSWGASLTILLGPIGLVIGAFKSIYDHWESIKKAFKTEGIIGGFKRIGQVLFDAVLKPLQQMLELISNIDPTGLSDKALAGIKNLRTDMNLVTEGEKKAQKLESPQVKQAKATANATVNGQVNVNVSANNGTNAQATAKNKGSIPVKLSPTQGAFGYKSSF